MIELSIIGAPAELDVIVLALTGVLGDVVEGGERYHNHTDARSRVYVRAAEVLPEFLSAAPASPLASPPAGSSPAGDPPAFELRPEDTADVTDPLGAMTDAARPATAALGLELYEVPTFAGDPPAPRQRWNPELGRHSWWHPISHWYVCLYCGVHKHKRPASGGRWFDEWGYRELLAAEWGTTRIGDPFPQCPGPGERVSRIA